MYKNEKEYNKFKSIAHKLDGLFDDSYKYAAIFNVSNEEASEFVDQFSIEKNLAQRGNYNAREFIINNYTKIISHESVEELLGIEKKEIFSIINFKHILKNSTYILYEMILSIYDISYIIDKFNLCNLDKAVVIKSFDDMKLELKLTGKDIKYVAGELAEEIRIKYTSEVDQIKFFSTLLFAKEIGQDVIDTLQYHNINEIGVRDKDYIYIVYKKAKIWLEVLSIQDDDTLKNILNHNAEASNGNFDEQNPTCIAAKESGSRVTVAAYSVTPTDDSYYYNERVFNVSGISLENLRDIYGTIDETIYQLLVLNQLGRGSYLCTGADMGVGKTTLFSAMLEKVPNKWGIGIIDTQNELSLKSKYPHKNIYTLIEDGKMPVNQLFEIVLKQARDIVGVGEINKPDEVLGLLDASLRLNAGACGSFHTSLVELTVQNLRNLLMRTGLYKNEDIAENDIASGIDILLHLSNHQKDRDRIVIDSITEIEAIGYNYELEPLIGHEHTYKEKIGRTLELAQSYLYKRMHHKNYRYRKIIQFNHTNDEWDVVNLPSQMYQKKIAYHTGKELLNTVIDHLESRMIR